MRQNTTIQTDDFQKLLYRQPQGQEKPADYDYYIEMLMFYIDLLLRRRWIPIVTFLITIIAGIYLSVTLPRIYLAETLILIEPQRVPDNFVRAIVPSDLSVQITTIKEMIMSRTNLLEIIEKFQLFNGPEYSSMFLDDKIESMRKLMEVTIVKGSGRAEAFRISYRGKNPEKIAQVVNSMANLVIDQNLKVRESTATGTVQFLDNELAKVRSELEKVETAYKDFRLNHMGELPDQLASNMMVLNRLQQELNFKQSSLRDEKNRLKALDSQIQFAREQAAITMSEMKQMQEAMDFDLLGESMENGQPTNPALEGLKLQLAELRTRYTPKHPDVIMLQQKIEMLEKETPLPPSNTDGSITELQEEIVSPMGNTFGAEIFSSDTSFDSEFVAQRKVVLSEIAAINEDILDLQKKIVLYQQRVENAPKMEQELLSLKRGYNNTQNTYESLLSRKQEAEVAANMERQQKGEQFRIIDPARKPDKPYSPNMSNMFLLFVSVGLGLGCGLIIAMDFIDRSVKRLETVPDKLGIPLLVVLPSLKKSEDIHKSRVNDLLSIIAVSICLALVSLFAAVSIIGMPGPTEFLKNL